jgi:hypothetical protein
MKPKRKVYQTGDVVFEIVREFEQRLCGIARPYA